MSLFVMVDGDRQGTISPADSSVLRGDGCFEAIRSYSGKLFRLDDHLDRLARSAAALELEMPDREQISSWLRQAAEESGDGVVRVVVSRGDAVPGSHGGRRCVIVAHHVPEPRPVRLWPVTAPWHPAGRPWELSGAKTISYAANLAAGRRAEKEGVDDALLISDDRKILEGPTFSVAWCRSGQVVTPPLSLGILDSITRRVVFEIWPEMVEGEEHLDAVLEADEVFAMSTVKEVVPVVGVGDRRFEPGPVTREIAQRFRALVGQ